MAYKKQVTVKVKVEQKPDHTFRVHGTFSNLKGMLHGGGSTKDEAITQMLAVAATCFSVPVNFKVKEITQETEW